jgi:hypothetical protein
MADFKAIYYGSRCLIERRDPYQAGEFLSVYLNDGGRLPSDPAMRRLFYRAVPICINLPTSLFLVGPFALMPWGPAHLLWLILIAFVLILACVLTWEISREYAPAISLVLVCLVLANCEILLMSGNLAGIAVSFCVISVWCFVRERYINFGLLLLAISLATKPQDTGLIWLFFLLAGGTYRKRALQSLGLTALIAFPAILWISVVSPNWIRELSSNLATTSAPGDLSDPGPASITARSPAMIIDLQTVFSYFRDDPRFYTTLSLLVGGGLLCIWALKALRTSNGTKDTWLALAAVTPLSMLPVYHRLYDAKLLLLTIPACCILWAKDGWTRWVGGLLTAASLCFTGDIPASIVDNLTRGVPRYESGGWNRILNILLIRQVPIILLALGVFYLWAYIRSSRELVAPGDQVSGRI